MNRTGRSVVLLLLVLAAAIAWWRLGSDRPAGGVPPVGASHSGAPAEAPADAPAAPIGAEDDPGAAAPLGEPPLPPPVDLATADRDLDLFGRVVDAAGAPVPGAEIECIHHPGRRAALLDPEAHALAIVEETARSAADGTFAIRLARGALRELRVAHPDFAETCVPGCQAGERVEVVLHPGARIELRTIDEAGAPVAEVKVRLWYPSGWSSQAGDRETLTDASGLAVIHALPPGRPKLALEHVTLGSPGWQDVEVAAGAVIPLEVVMPAGRTIAGTVTVARTGRPIAGARVGDGWTMRRAVETDAQGNYRLTGFRRNGWNEIAVEATGYGREKLTVPQEDDRSPIDFALAPAMIAVGRITDSSGVPLGGVEVRTVASVRSGPGQRIDSGSAITQESGSFRLDSLHPDLPHTLVVMEPGYGRTLLDFDARLRGPSGTIDLGTIALPPALSIEGEVVDDREDPMPGVEVHVSGHNEDRGRLRPGEPIPGDFYGRSEERRTDDLGRFRFPDLVPGTYRVTARPRGRPESSATVELVAGTEEPAFLRIELDGGLEFRIAVEDPEGEPIPGVTVSARGSNNVEGARQVTASEGSASFAGIEGPVRISVFPPKGYLVHKSLEIDPNGQTERVRLARSVAVAGIVTSLAGEPEPGFLVRATLGDGGIEYERPFSTVSDVDGRFVIDVPEGSVVDIDCDGTRSVIRETRRSQWVPLEGVIRGVRAPAEALHVRLAPIPDDATLTIRVVDETGSPVEGARVSAFNERDGRSSAGEERMTDSEGLTRFDGVHQIVHVVTCTPPEREPPDGLHWIRPPLVRVSPEEHEVRVELLRGRGLAVRVIDAAGAPVERLHCTAVTSRSRQLQDRVLGGFVAFLLADGETADVTVSGRAADGKSYRGELRGVAAGDAEVRIVVRTE